MFCSQSTILVCSPPFQYHATPSCGLALQMNQEQLKLPYQNTHKAASILDFFSLRWFLLLNAISFCSLQSLKVKENEISHSILKLPLW